MLRHLHTSHLPLFFGFPLTHNTLQCISHFTSLKSTSNPTHTSPPSPATILSGHSIVHAHSDGTKFWIPVRACSATCCDLPAPCSHQILSTTFSKERLRASKARARGSFRATSSRNSWGSRIGIVAMRDWIQCCSAGEGVLVCSRETTGTGGISG
jgi:hypothetical protein